MSPASVAQANSARPAVDRGTIHLDGRPVHRADPAAMVRAGVVQVPEGRQVFTDLTVAESLRAGGLAAPRTSRAPEPADGR